MHCFFVAGVITTLIAVYIIYIIVIKKNRQQKEKEQELIELDLIYEEKLRCYKEFAEAFKSLNDDHSVLNCNRFVTVAK